MYIYIYIYTHTHPPRSLIVTPSRRRTEKWSWSRSGVAAVGTKVKSTTYIMLDYIIIISVIILLVLSLSYCTLYEHVSYYTVLHCIIWQYTFRIISYHTLGMNVKSTTFGTFVGGGFKGGIFKQHDIESCVRVATVPFAYIALSELYATSTTYMRHFLSWLRLGWLNNSVNHNKLTYMLLNIT